MKKSIQLVQIIQKDYLNQAKKGILKAVEVGLYPVKINMKQKMYKKYILE